jgi:hypothetical protein
MAWKWKEIQTRKACEGGELLWEQNLCVGSGRREKKVKACEGEKLIWEQNLWVGSGRRETKIEGL